MPNFKYFVAIILTSITLSAWANPDKSESNHRYIFYQPWENHKSIDRNTWDKIESELKIQGYTHLIFQWTQYGVVEFHKKNENQLFEKSFKRNKKQKIEFIYGLYIGADYYHALTKNDNDLEIYLANSRIVTIQIANTITKQSENKISGWYLPEEVDDLHWKTYNRKLILKKHFILLANELNKLTPYTPIYASAFFGNYSSPSSYADQLNEISSLSNITWFIQDGLGSGRMSAHNTSKYLKKLTSKLKNKYWIGVLEVFSTKKTSKNVDIFCKVDDLEIQERIDLWEKATHKMPDSIFSLNQILSSILNPKECSSLNN